LPCELSVAGRDYSGTIVNISSGGLFAQTEARPPVGAEVDARVALREDDEATLMGIVAHNKMPSSPRLLSVDQSGIGLRIHDASDTYFDFLDSLACPNLGAEEPLVRGVVFRHVAEQLRVLNDEGWVSAGELDRVLEHRDFAQLYGEFSRDRWYPVVSLGRFLDVLQARVCGGDPATLVNHAEEVAKEVLDSAEGEYFLAQARRPGVDAGLLVARCAQRDALNFSRWRFEGESLRDFRILVTEADAIGDAGRLVVQGILQLLFSRIAGMPVQVSSERVSGDSILYLGTGIH